MNKAEITEALEQPLLVNQLASKLASLTRHLRAQTVVAPALGGLVIGAAVARELGARFIYAEKENDTLAIRRFKLTPGERILIVDDIIRTGCRVQQVIKSIKVTQAQLVGISVITGKVNWQTPFFSLF